MTTPKCMGLMLNAWMVGSSIGAMMMMAGTVSRKQPTISRNTLMTSNNTTGLSDRLAIKLVIIWGTCSKVMKVENTVEVPSRKEVTPLRTAAVPLAELVDLEKEKARIEKELKKNRAELDKLEAKLGNPGFVNKAPAHVVEAEQDRAEKLRALLAKLEESAASMA